LPQFWKDLEAKRKELQEQLPPNSGSNLLGELNNQLELLNGKKADFYRQLCQYLPRSMPPQPVAVLEQSLELSSPCNQWQTSLSKIKENIETKITDLQRELGKLPEPRSDQEKELMVECDPIILEGQKALIEIQKWSSDASFNEEQFLEAKKGLDPIDEQLAHFLGYAINVARIRTLKGLWDESIRNGSANE
jgi:hypothetical protein